MSAEIESIPLLKDATLDQALYDGEDYELLFTSRQRFKNSFRIGSITKGEPGRILYQGVPLQPRGYDHFQHRP